jgi:hypothetical protein
MTIANGNLAIIGLGTSGVRYYWKGSEIPGVVKVFVYKGTKLTMTVTDANAVPAEIKESGIKIKEQR